MQNPTHLYENEGSYTVTLTTVNTFGLSTKQKVNYIAVTAPPPFLEGWSYRKLHTISGSPSVDLTDYQVRFRVYNITGTDSGENVYLGSNVKPDFSDLRFTTTANTIMPYWIQETGSNHAIVWVKIPSVPTSGTQIYLYYGNSSAPSLSDGSATFIFFDDFVGNNLNNTRWTKSGDVTVTNSIVTLNAVDEKLTSSPTFGSNTAMQARVSMKPSQYGLIGFGNDNNLAAVYANYPATGNYNGLNRANSLSTQSSLSCGALDVWNILEIRRSTSVNDYIINDITKGSISQYLIVGSYPIYIWSQGSSQVIQLDWIFIRNSIPVEPTQASWNPEEFNPIPPVSLFSANPISGQPPLLVQFTDQSSGSPTT